MSPSVVNFKQLTDLAVNPSLGTINTELLHNLLLVIVDQLQLSSNFMELDEKTMKNVAANSEAGCSAKVTEFSVVDELDGSSGELEKVRKEIAKPAVNQTVKLFTVRDDETSLRISSDVTSFHAKPQQDQKNSAPAIGIKAVKNKCVTLKAPENALKPIFNAINCTKRIEALEIGTRQLADIMKQFKCDCDKMNGVQSEQRREIDFLQQNIESALAELRELKDWKSEVSSKGDEMVNMIRELEGSASNFSSENQKNLDAIAVLKAQFDELKSTLDEK